MESVRNDDSSGTDDSISSGSSRPPSFPIQVTLEANSYIRTSSLPYIQVNFKDVNQAKDSEQVDENEKPLASKHKSSRRCKRKLAYLTRPKKAAKKIKRYQPKFPMVPSNLKLQPELMPAPENDADQLIASPEEATPVRDSIDENVPSTSKTFADMTGTSTLTTFNPCTDSEMKGAEQKTLYDWTNYEELTPSAIPHGQSRKSAPLINIKPLEAALKEIGYVYSSRIKCPGPCKLTFHHKGNYLIHMVRIHAPELCHLLGRQCNIEGCKTFFTSWTDEREHYETHLPLESRILWKCSECGDKLSRFRDFGRHKLRNKQCKSAQAYAIRMIPKSRVPEIMARERENTDEEEEKED